MSDRYTLSYVRSALDPDFSTAYALLDAEFGSRGELERREALAGYLQRASDTLGYRLVIARDAQRAVAAVRDCHVTKSPKLALVVVYLSHLLVVPAHRRRGAGRLMLEVATRLGEEARERHCPGGDVLLVAEMEPWSSGEPDSVTRLVVYGKNGFKVIDPRALPYLQPDYRAHAEIDATGSRPVPLLPVVRWVDHETARQVPRGYAAAYAEQLYELVRSHCRDADLAPLAAHALGALEKTPGDTVPLLDLPRDAHDDSALAPLAKERVYPYYPPSLLASSRKAEKP